MNRQIIRYAYPISAAILLIFGWVVVQRLARGIDAIIPLAVAALVVWPLGTIAFIDLWPRITVGGFKRAILGRGFGEGPTPINSLRAIPDRPSRAASSAALMAVGTDDLVYVVGWLDVGRRPHVLHVPEMDGRYYSVQITDPVSGANVGYVGKRTTGTHEGEFLICDRSWPGNVPDRMTRIDLPNRSALVIGRVFAADDEDRRTAVALAEQIRLAPLDDRP